MSHQDTDGLTVSPLQHQALNQALDWLLRRATLANVAFRKGCTWSPKALIYAAILWAWSDERTLTDRFFLARKVIIAMGILEHLPATSYQAFLKILRHWSTSLASALIMGFRQCMQSELRDRFRISGFCLFGVDGSRLELPRTESNEQRFSPPLVKRPSKRKGKSAKRSRRARSQAERKRRAVEKKINSPQMWVTTMFHIGTGLLWDWRTGPSHSSEREHLGQMLDALPAGALITADAGFAGYATWNAILESGRHLLIRVGANVRLLRKLNYIKEKDTIVYLWPNRQLAQCQPPLVLRLVVVNNGRHPVYLVTSVLERTRLSDQEIARIYGFRWGIELLYRHLKQTFERRKLRSHSPDHAELEATWSLLGLWAMSLHAQFQQLPLGIPPARMSTAKVLRAYRKSLREYQSASAPGESLSELLSEAVIDSYPRTNKTSREYPRKKHEPAPGAPEIVLATRVQIHAANQLRNP